VQFIYTDTVEDNVLVKGAYELLILGDKYQIPGLVQLAEGEMIKQLKRDNMVAFLATGDMYRAENLRRAALKLTKDSLPWIQSRSYRTEELKKLNKDLLLQLL